MFGILLIVILYSKNKCALFLEFQHQSCWAFFDMYFRHSRFIYKHGKHTHVDAPTLTPNTCSWIDTYIFRLATSKHKFSFFFHYFNFLHILMVIHYYFFAQEITLPLHTHLLSALKNLWKYVLAMYLKSHSSDFYNGYKGTHAI